MAQFDRMDDGQGADDLVQLVIDQLEELIVTVLEVIRERPVVAAAIAAGIVGAVVGVALAKPKQRQPELPERADLMNLLAGLLGAVARAQIASLGGQAAEAVGKQANKARQNGASAAKGGLSFKALSDFGSLSDLAGLSMQLMENPIVRNYLRSMLGSRLRKGFGG